MWRRPAKWASFYHHPHRLSNFCGHLWIFVWKVYLAAVDSYVVSHCSTWNSTSNIRFKIFQVFGLFAITMCCFQCCRYSHLHHLVVDLCLPAFPKRGVDPSIHDRSRNEWATVGITKSFLATWIFFSFVFFSFEKVRVFVWKKRSQKVIKLPIVSDQKNRNLWYFLKELLWFALKKLHSLKFLSVSYNVH